MLSRSSFLGFLLTTLTLLTASSALPTQSFPDLVARKSTPKSKPSPSPAPKPRANSNTYLAPAPRWVIYTDEGLPNNQVVPDVEDMEGFNVLILSFYMSNGPSDQVANWKRLSNETRTQIVKNYHAHNISIMMSVFGGADTPMTSGTDPVKFAQQAAEFVKDYQLDGVDVDWEDFKALSKNDGSAENWIVTLTNELRTHLPNDSYFLTHAPVAPWFTTNQGTYPHGAYRAVAQRANESIDWFNVQYYNQGNMYSTCEHLITASPDGAFPHTSVWEIHDKSNVPLQKLVIGKPARKNDAYNGQDYMTPADEAACLAQASKSMNWTAGAMFWEFHGSLAKEKVNPNTNLANPSSENGNDLTPSALIKTIRGTAFPLKPKSTSPPKKGGSGNSNSNNNSNNNNNNDNNNDNNDNEGNSNRPNSKLPSMVDAPIFKF